MKKRISLFLALVLLALSLAPAAAAEREPYGRVNDRIPTVLIAGDGNALFVPDETAENGERQIFHMSEHSENLQTEDSNVYDALAAVLLPFFKEGLLKNNWDPYYENLEKEIGDLFAEIRLDGNGDPQYGSSISKADQASNEYNQHNDNKGEKGYYGLWDYEFWYDWRLNPLESARELHAFVKNVKRVTGAKKIALFSTCLGSNVALAYISKYGTDDFYSLRIDATVANGAEFISESISGKFKLDGNAIVRFFESAGATGMFDLDAFWIATIDLATKAGLLKGISKLLHATIYDKVVEGVTSAIALGTFFTMPCYWSCVCPEDYSRAIRYVFGEPGSEKRQEYAGLIKKLNSYHKRVGLKVPELLASAADNGVLVSILAKYGMQMAPLNQTNTAISDEFASVTRASFGATTSTIYDTLSDDYIAQRVAEGKGKYISPDKQVDASTCMFPDSTWFVKGATHVRRTGAENDMLYICITADRQLTVDDFDWTQFMVYDNETGTMFPMTEENCHSEAFSTNKEDYEPSGFFAKIKAFFNALKRWFKLLPDFIKAKRAEKAETEAA